MLSAYLWLQKYEIVDNWASKNSSNVSPTQEKWQASQHLCMDFPNPNVDDRQPPKSRNMISSPMKKVLSAAEKVKRAGCKN